MDMKVMIKAQTHVTRTKIKDGDEKMGMRGWIPKIRWSSTYFWALTNANTAKINHSLVTVPMISL
jgi:hypothetical protein